VRLLDFFLALCNRSAILIERVPLNQSAAPLIARARAVQIAFGQTFGGRASTFTGRTKKTRAQDCAAIQTAAATTARIRRCDAETGWPARTKPPAEFQRSRTCTGLPSLTALTA